MSEKFITIRHSYDDHSYIDGKNDTSLTNRGIDIARDMANRIPSLIDTDKKIILRHSVKKRAAETAEILCDKLEEMNLDYEIIPEKNLTELYQGQFRNLDLLTHENKVNLLQSCWEEFDDHRVNGNFDYRFGDPINAINGKIDSKFVSYPYGESQRDFSIRIGRAVYNIYEDISRGRQSISITHRGAIREISNLVNSINNNITMGQFPDFEIAGMKYCEIIEFYAGNVDVAKRSLLKYIKDMKDVKNNN